jgi:site-specific recombinase XerD
MCGCLRFTSVACNSSTDCRLSTPCRNLVAAYCSSGTLFADGNSGAPGLAEFCEPGREHFQAVEDAATAFIELCESEGLQFSTVRKCRNTLNRLKAFCEDQKIDSVDELNTDYLDAFRAGRALKSITSSKELQLLRQFCGFCFDRKWASENAAKRIKAPRNIKPNDVEPFSTAEVMAVIEPCDGIGRGPYERLRARAMILTLRYTALRIGDVALLSRDRLSRESGRWCIFLRTEKSGKPVFCPFPEN